MSKLNVSQIAKDVRTSVVKHSPEILTGLGVAGMFTATAFAVKATPKAMRLIEEKKEELGTEELTPVETVKAAWKPYIPTAIMLAASSACIIGASSVNAKRNAAIAAAYTLSDTALREYKEKVIETIGKEADATIREKIADDRLKEKPVSKSDVIITGKGETLCLDYFSGRYFTSDVDKINKAIIEINRLIITDGYASINDFYDELDLSHTKQGDELGWTINDGYVDIDFSTRMSDDGRPCIVIDYTIAPKYDYYKFS